MRCDLQIWPGRSWALQSETSGPTLAEADGASTHRDPGHCRCSVEGEGVVAAIAAPRFAAVSSLRAGCIPRHPGADARRSWRLPVALANGREILGGSYADWCEVCRTMARSIEAIETEQRGAVDLVRLNVDNPVGATRDRALPASRHPPAWSFDKKTGQTDQQQTAHKQTNAWVARSLSGARTQTVRDTEEPYGPDDGTRTLTDSATSDPRGDVRTRVATRESEPHRTPLAGRATAHGLSRRTRRQTST